MRLTPSGSQTVGPFFRIGLEHLCSRNADARLNEDAQRISIRGRVLDGEGVPVPDAVLEIWHADSAGRYRAEPQTSVLSGGLTRAATDENGSFSFAIVRPGAIVCSPEQKQAPHIAVLVFARGLLRHLMTRMYFPHEPANDSDPVLQVIPEERRSTLIAHEDAEHSGALEWNVVLQGRGETVFFAW
jgi:protocatechuate 3,4-dioxygenase, alpha subunit